jgi:hypothetical protein
MDFSGAAEATQAVWGRQDAALDVRTRFHMSAEGRDISVWTQDAKGEELLRKVLNELRIPHSEGDTQQVVTWLDSVFGD